MKQTAVTFLNRKEAHRSGTNTTPLTMVTAYDFTQAQIVDEAGVDGILVGDSLGMTVLGYDTTLPVTIEDMLHHTKAVQRAKPQALVVADLPFMSYHISVEEAVRNAGRLIQEGGADAVKLEGGVQMADRITAITHASIPVMAHLGLTPQSVRAFGGFKVQGKTQQTAQQLLDDARAVQDSGAFAVVLECVPSLLAQRITEELDIPTIGIGAGSDCDGQILVYHDVLGLYSKSPRFSQQFAQLRQEAVHGLTKYTRSVIDGNFPQSQHEFAISKDIINLLQ